MNFDNKQSFFFLLLSQRGSQRTELSMNYGDDHYPIKIQIQEARKLLEHRTSVWLFLLIRLVVAKSLLAN